MHIQTPKDYIAQISQTPDSDPSVQFFTGLDGIKQAYLETLTISPEEPIYAFLHPSIVTDELYQWLTTDYVNQRVAKGIFAHVFVTSDRGSERVAQYLESDQQEKRQTHVVEAYEHHFDCEVNIYDGKVAFYVFDNPDTYQAVIINNPTVSQTLKSFYLHYLWKI